MNLNQRDAESQNRITHKELALRFPAPPRLCGRYLFSDTEQGLPIFDRLAILDIDPDDLAGNLSLDLVH